MPEKKPVRTRDAERTQSLILQAAKHEFATHGLGGARLDRIAEQASVDKRLIYYYFKSKTELFRIVLEQAYQDIRTAERQLDLLKLEPIDAIKRLISFTWQYYLDNPEFLRLINSANLFKAEHLTDSERIPDSTRYLIETLQEVLEKGRRQGLFHGGIDAAQLYMSISGATFAYLSNHHTLSLVFNRDLMSPKALEARLSHVNDLILGYLLVG